LATLDGNIVPSTVREEIADSLDALAERQIYPAGLRFVALAFALNGRDKAALTWLNKASARCPGYRRYPDFTASINTTSNVVARTASMASNCSCSLI
jgi:hypothetical protein